MYYQQGDVIIEKIDEIPTNAVKKEVVRVVLAEGESTGHAHVIDDVVNCDLFCDKIDMLLSDDVYSGELSISGIKQVKNRYSLDRILEKYDRLFSDSIDRFRKKWLELLYNHYC